ncbi:MAG: hypothetical protein HC862_09775 [Scytonema sp. RU_4_4]|nr:hypothetical protein [Scytonema sp. RU_4_4]
MSTGKGKKRVKNQPALHEEMKKRRGIFLTNTAWEFVCEEAVKQQTSASEYVESLIQQKRRETKG